MHVPNVTTAAALAAVVTLTAGCESRDERLAEYARQAMSEQARQNETMARQSEQVVQHSGELAKTAENLVQQDAAARRELIAAQAKIQSQINDERVDLNARRDQLHADEQSLTIAMNREPVVAQAVLTSGLIIAALLPLLVTIYALNRLPDSSATDDRLLADALLNELACQPAIGHDAVTRPAIEDANQSLIAGPGDAPTAPTGPQP